MEFGILLCTSVSLIGGLIAVILFFTAYNPENRRRAAILHQAQVDFKQARGAGHLRLLQERQPVLAKRLDRLEQEIKRLQGELQVLHAGEHMALRQAAGRQLITQNIHTIQGVGPKLQEALLELALQGGLEQLHYAQNTINGIGAARQAVIDSWVVHTQKALAAYLQTDFPEKSTIQQHYAAQRARFQARIQELASQYSHWRAIEQCAQVEIARLSQVSEVQLAAAMLETDQPGEAIDHYIQGVFGEWEPLPEWFVELADLRTP